MLTPVQDYVMARSRPHKTSQNKVHGHLGRSLLSWRRRVLPGQWVRFVTTPTAQQSSKTATKSRTRHDGAFTIQRSSISRCVLFVWSLTNMRDDKQCGRDRNSFPFLLWDFELRIVTMGQNHQYPLQ